MKRKLIATTLIMAILAGCALNIGGVRDEVVEVLVDPTEYLAERFIDWAVREMADSLVEGYNAKCVRVSNLDEVVSMGRNLIYEVHKDETERGWLAEEVRKEIREQACQFLFAFADNDTLRTLYDEHIDEILEEMRDQTRWEDWSEERVVEMFLLYQERADQIATYLLLASSPKGETITRLNSELLEAESHCNLKWKMDHHPWGSPEDDASSNLRRIARERVEEKRNALLAFVEEEGGVPRGWTNYQLLRNAQFFERRRQEGADLIDLREMAQDLSLKLGDQLLYLSF